MSKQKLLITIASWEPRFLFGAERVLGEDHPTSVLYFWFEEYGERTANARGRLDQMVAGLPSRAVKLNWGPITEVGGNKPILAHASVWKTVYNALEEVLKVGDEFILDITTMPRESIWIILDILADRGHKGTIRYHKAIEHGDWCGCEPGAPHIVPKLGGLPDSDFPTKLLIVAGYDQDRSEQFIAHYEPIETLILCQDGVHAENMQKNIERHKTRFGNRGSSIKLEGVDCYSNDWGYRQIFSIASEFGAGANLLMASLGPKTSAVALYRAHRELECTSLVYAPCGDYNTKYSDGISNSLSIEW